MQINDQTVRVLIDSGSTECFAGPELINALPEGQKALYDLPQPMIGTVANGQRFDCSKAVNLDIKIGSDVVPVTAYFSDTLKYPLIIGYNVLSQKKLVVDFESLSIFRKPDTQVKLLKSVTLPQMSETVLYGYLREPVPDGVGLISTSSQLKNIGLLAANAIVNVDKRRIVPVKVMNLASEPISLPAHYCVAHCDTITEQDIYTPNEDCDAPKLNATTMQEASGDSQDRRTKDEFAKQFKINEKVTSEEQSQLVDLLWEFKDIFPADGQKLGCTDLIEFKITLRDDAKPLKARPYRSNPTIRREISKQVQQMLDDDIIRPSTSNYVSPVLLVAKADGSLRFVTDFRKNNSQNIVPETSYIPRIDCSLQSLGSAKARLFTTLDLLKGYWQIAISEESKKYTAFITHDGVFEYNRMPFGLANSPACFMRLMTRVLQGLMWETCLVYLDDIIVFSSTFAEHLKRLREVFERVRSANLSIKSRKCNFLCEEIQFLGHIITKDGILPLPSKVEAIKNFPRPTNVKDVQSFLGLVGYYRKFIKNFASIAGPLHDLTHADVDFNWTEKCENAFTELRDALTKPPVLAYPEYDEPYILETDASDQSAGFILSQRQDGKIRPIAYSGKRLNDAQRNYSTTEKEALAVVLGFQQFDSFLRGNKVQVVTDHIALKWLLSNKNPKGRLARWVAYLQQFNFEVQHKAGKAHTNADCLSRIDHPSDASDVEDHIDDDIFPSVCSVDTTAHNDCETQGMCRLLATDAQPSNINIYPVTQWSHDVLRKHQLNDEYANGIISYLENDKLPESDTEARKILLCADLHTINNGVLYRYRDRKYTSEGRQVNETNYCLVVPSVLKTLLLTEFHGVSSSCHFGYKRTYATLRLKYFWPGMLSDVRNWVLSCTKCNTKKPAVRPTRAPLQPLPPTMFGERWAMDLTLMPRSTRGNRYILAFTEYNTRYVEAFPIPNSKTATIARILVDEICFRYGPPQCLLSDLGANLISAVVAETCKLFQIEQITTSGYRPQTNALVEGVIKTMSKNLAMYVNPRHTDWDVYVRAVCYAYNTSVCTESTNFVPFYLMYGRLPLRHVDAVVLPNFHPDETVQESIVKLQEAREVARQNVLATQERMKQRYDQKVVDPDFQEGDLVWIYFPQIVVGGTKKFYHNYSGPYVLLEKVGPVDFTASHAHNGKKLKNRVHVNRMKRFHHRTVMPPPMENPQDVVMEGFEIDELNPVDQERVSKMGGEESAHLPPKRGSYIMESAHSLGEADCERSQRQDLATSPVAVQDEGHGEAAVMPPVDVEGSQKEQQKAGIYEVNKIIHKKFMKNGNVKYLIDWKGYGEEERTYEPFENLNKCAQEYVKTHDIPAINKPRKSTKS